MAIITAAQIVQIAPAVRIESLSSYIPFIDPCLIRWGVRRPADLGAFFANVSVESAHFKRTLEIASGADYEGRKDLGNIVPGDGIKFKGRGLIQLTGRTVYTQCSRDLFGNGCLITSPSLLEAPEAALNSALWFWTKYKGISQITAEPEDWTRGGDHNYTKFQYIVVRINGGLNDYQERFENYERARKVLNF